MLSPAVRIWAFWIQIVKLGTAAAMRMPTMTTTTMTSMIEKPLGRRVSMVSTSPCG